VLEPGIPSKQFSVWTRLYRRYRLEPNPAVNGGGPDVLKTIQPFTDADQLLRAEGARTGNVTITGATAFYALTVPADRRWLVYSARAILISGTWSFQAIIARDASRVIGTALTANPLATEDVVLIAGGLPMAEGDQLGVTVDVHSVNGTCTIDAWIEEEEIF